MGSWIKMINLFKVLFLALFITSCNWFEKEDEKSGSDPLNLIWSYPINKRLFPPDQIPIITNEKIAANIDGYLTCFNTETSERLWRIPIDTVNYWFLPFYIYDGTKIYVRSNKQVFAINFIDGSLAWKIDLETENPVDNTTSMAALNGRLFIASYHSMYVLDCNSGNEVFRKENSEPYVYLLSYKQKLFASHHWNRANSTIQDGMVSCINPSNGDTIWTYNDFSSEEHAIFYDNDKNISVSNNKVYHCNASGDLTCLDSETGKIIWKKINNSDQSSTWETPLIDDKHERFFISSSYFYLQSRKISDGSLIWSKKDLESGTTTNPMMFDGTYLFKIAHTLGGIFLLNPDNGSVVWKFDPDDASVRMYAANERYVTMESDWKFYVFKKNY